MPWEGDPDGGLEECEKRQGRPKNGGRARSVGHGKGEGLGLGTQDLGFSTS